MWQGMKWPSWRNGEHCSCAKRERLPSEVVTAHGFQAGVHRDIFAGLNGVTRRAMKGAVHPNLACSFSAHGANRGVHPRWNRLYLSMQVAVEFLCVFKFIPIRRHVALQGFKRWLGYTCAHHPRKPSADEIASIKWWILR